MYIYRIILWFLITLFSLNLIYLILKKTEGFEDADPETALKTQVNTQITQANDVLCPIYKELLQNRMDNILVDKENNVANKCNAKSQALESLNKDTNNLLFVCPPPTDPMLVPNNIDKYIEKTSILFNSFLDTTKQNIEKSLSCQPKKEGFEDIPDDSTCAAVVATAKPNTLEAKKEDPALKQQRIQALQLKSDALKKGLINPLFISLIDKYNELKEIKRKAESGELKPNCSS